MGKAGAHDGDDGFRAWPREQLIKGLEITTEAFSYGACRTYQVPVRHIEDITGLSFGRLADADPLSRQEAAIPAREVRRPDHLLL